MKLELSEFFTSSAFQTAIANRVQANGVRNSITRSGELFDTILLLRPLQKLERSGGYYLTSLRFVRKNLSRVTEEPVFKGLSWKRKRGSGFTTGLLTSELLRPEIGLTRSERDILVQQAIELYESLRYGDEPYFLHDSEVEIGRHVPRVLNIGAFYALVLTRHDEIGYLPKIIPVMEGIYKQQRSDGIFPYIASTPEQKYLLTILPKLVRNRIARRYYGDHHIDFFDISHQCYITWALSEIHRISEVTEISELCECCIRRSLEYLSERLEEGNLFEEEPDITAPRFCNFNDTNSLFLLRDIMKSWGQGCSEKIFNRELRATIVDKEDLYFAPLDKRNAKSGIILPAVWMSDSWKANLLC